MLNRTNIPTARVLVWGTVACVIAAILAVPVGLGVAYADTALGIRIIDRTQTPGAGEGATALGIRITAPTYTIKWNPNEGIWSDKSSSEKSTSVVYDSIPSAPDTPGRTGYTFKGWSTNANATTATSPLPPATAAAAWYAVWEAKTYTLTLNPGAGSGGSTTASVKYGSSLPAIQIPSRTGYSFDGYFDSESGGTQYYTSTGTSANTWNKAANATLYAHWTAKKYTVSFNANGGTGGQTAAVNATYDAPMPTISTTPPSRTGYRFAGWYDAMEGGTQFYDAGGTSKANWNKTAATTLYAHWTLQINCAAPATALVTVDAAGNVTGESQLFTSTTAEDIKVTAVKSTRSESAPSLFADDTTINGVRILLKPTTGGASSEVKVPLTVNETSLPANWTIAANTKLAVAFSLSLPSGAQLNYLANDGQVSVASLSYEVSAANAS